MATDCLGVAVRGGEVDTSRLQQVQAPVIGTACPSQLFDARVASLIAGVRLTHRSANRRGAAWPSTGWSLGGKLWLGYPQGRQMR
ncbi:MAG: hypothetical protein ACRDRF_18150, partial [Pseudonocardiaceae bacterium]